jgi:hypothetical protein
MGGGATDGFERDELLMPKWRVRLLVTLAVLAPALGTALADSPKKTPDPATDAELLEFLGSVDSGADSQAADDGSWIDYLAQTDIGKVAKTTDPNGAPRPKPVAGSQPPAPGDKNDQ